MVNAYSRPIAITGLTRVARLAGSQLASTLTSTNPAAVPRKLNESVVLRPATRNADRG